MDLVKLKGSCVVRSFCAFTGKLIGHSYFENVIFDRYKEKMAEQQVKGNGASIIKALALSRTQVGLNPIPDALIQEFRIPARVYQSGQSIQITANMAASEGNGSTNIIQAGFYYGADTTTVLGTGILGSLLDVSIEKNSAIELAFTYEIRYV